ncbi:MAG TPA: NAD(P)H-binding protein [Gemmatimonadales bacterium]
MTPDVSRTALVAGATGLVGSHVLNFLLADDTWAHVVTVGRRTSPQRHEKLEQRVVDLGALEAMADLPHCDDVFCCLGTTIKQAGSQPAFRRVDQAFVLALARAGLRAGATQFLLVSAVGADPESRIFYSRVKGETESGVRKLPYRAVQIFRPSLLLGARAEFRLGERIALILAPVMPVVLPGRLRRYRPIQAATVARAMLQIAREAPRGPNVFEYDAMLASAGA